MHATYWNDDDILEVKFSDKSIVREVSETWHAILYQDVPRHCSCPRCGSLTCGSWN